jgi:hypothetical protein
MPRQYNDNAELDVRKAYFVGTTELASGQVLCFQELLANVTKGLGVDVEAINSDNVGHFAGIVDESSVGVTGPANINLRVPKVGEWFDAQVEGTTDVAIGDKVKLDATKGCFIRGGETTSASDVITETFGIIAIATAANTGTTKVVQKLYRVQ